MWPFQLTSMPRHGQRLACPMPCWKNMGPPGALRASLGPCGPPWALVGSPRPLWAGPLWAPLGPCGKGPCGRPWALVGRALVGPPRPLWALLGPTDWPRLLPMIGHSPHDDRRRHRNWIWPWPSQLHDDPQSVSHKRGGWYTLGIPGGISLGFPCDPLVSPGGLHESAISLEELHHYWTLFPHS